MLHAKPLSKGFLNCFSLNYFITLDLQLTRLASDLHIFRDIRETIMLTEIGEFLIDIPANITAINDPHLQLAPFIYLFEIR
jgi:hypothetical protein